jgi:NAD(P)-dependent dehydrogenase (short-subunit alcohol dehydrogenase family)
MGEASGQQSRLSEPSAAWRDEPFSATTVTDGRSLYLAPMELADRVVVITGGAGGIGSALGRRFVSEGARAVVVVDRDQSAVDRVADELSGLGAEAFGRAVDVTDEAAVQALVGEVEDRFGPIDLFCSNAGAGAGGGVEAPDDAWQAQWDLHVMAHVYAARAVLPSMIVRGEGYLLQTASAAGLLAALGSAPYTVTKAACIALAEHISITHGDEGIRVSVLCPQGVNTAMAPRQLGDGATDGIIEPEAVADVVVEALRAERFLVLPHPEVQTYVERKAADRDRWLAGMRKLRRRSLES